VPAVLIFINRIAFVLGVAAVALAGGTARAEGTEQQHDWRCWYNAPEHVSCAPKSARARVVSPHSFLHIPLHTIPFDMSGVRTLAQSIVCGSRPECRMVFTQGMPTGEELDLLMDPIWAMAD
jgi:hypothetical protein